MTEIHPALSSLERYQELEAEIGEIFAEARLKARPLFDERDELLALRAEEMRYAVPKKRNQTDTQQKLQRCPRCRGQLDTA